MTRNRLLILGAVIVVAALGVFLVLSRRGGDAAPADATPTAVVTVAQVRVQPLQDVVSAYGLVQADPAASTILAAPKAAIVARVLVRSGESVAAGQTLMELANAPGSELAFKQASDAVTFARNDLARVQRLFDERLAANDQLNTARKTLADAEAALTAQQQQGSGRAVLALTSPQAGVVTTVSAAAGDHVAQDAALVTLARAGAVVVKLGLQPSVAVAAGQPVTLHPVFGGPPITSRIAMVGHAADQTTKTLDAVVPLPGATLPIGGAVEGDVVTGVHTGKLAPRAAVVFDETGPHVFTVSAGKAHRVFVKTGLDHGADVEIAGPIPAGTQVVVEGAYELQDGMAVKVRR